MMRLLSKRSTAAALGTLIGAVALAQAPMGMPVASKLPGADTLYLSTTVGSFKFLPGSTELTHGTMDIDFEGTVMVSGLVGTIALSPGVRLELDRPDHQRKVYFGKGHLRLSGDFRSVQFFGRNLKGSYKGNAVARLYGEFDKNMETGYFWYGSDPKKVDWGTYGHTVNIPLQTAPVPVVPKVRDLPKGSG